MERNNAYRLLSLALLTAVSVSCQKASDETPVAAPSVVATVPKQVYVSSGICNSGSGVTTYVVASASKMITKWNADTGVYNGLFLDFNSGSFITGSAPQNIIDDGANMFVLVENGVAANKAIIKVPKSDPNNYSTYYANATTLSAVLRGFAKDTDGSLILGKTSAIEKITPAQGRATIGANPWINAPLGNCATSTTAMSAVAIMNPLTSAGYTSGKVIFAHGGGAAATNRIAIVRDSGFVGATDCLAGAQTNIVGHIMASNRPTKTMAFNAVGPTPTSIVYIPMPTPTATATGRILVTYSNNQTSNSAAGTYNLNHGIVAWDVLEDNLGAVTLSNAPVVLWDDMSVVYGASAITYDSASSSVYVGVGGEPGVAAATYATNVVGYNVEKFTYSLSANTLTRVTISNRPFIHGDATTKCISGIAIGE